MTDHTVLKLETTDGASIEAGLGRGYRTWEEESCANQQEVQIWLDRVLLDSGFYDDGRWFQPAWAGRFKPGADLAVPGGHKVFRALIQAPYIDESGDTDRRLRDCGLASLGRTCSLLWSVLRWAQGGFSDVEIRHNAFEVGLIQAYIPPRRWEPIRPERADLPDLASILQQQAKDARIDGGAGRLSPVWDQESESTE